MKILKWVGVVLVVIIACYLGFNYFEPKLGTLMNYDLKTNTTDVIGTRIPTVSTTLGYITDIPLVGVASTAATTSYISMIGQSKNVASYMIKVTAVASTTANSATFFVWGSNDDKCDTTFTSSTVNPGEVIQSWINWYPVVNNLPYDSTAFPTMTNVAAGDTEQILLTNLNFECLKLDVTGVSTTLYASIRAK